MAISLLVSDTELESYMGACWSDDDRAAAIEILTDVQGALEDFLNRPVTIRSFSDEVHVRGAFRFGTRERNVYLPHTPVHSITSVKADGVVQDLSREQLKPWGIYRYFGPTGVNRTVVVEYTAGLDGESEEFAGMRGKIKRAAAREMQRRADRAQGAKRLSDEGFSVEYLEPEDVFTKSELRSLTRYKRRNGMAA